MADNELLLAYSVLDELYQNGLIKQIEGLPAGAQSEVASITDPGETYVPLGPKEGDPKVFSYAYGQDPAILIARVTTPGSTSTCEYTLAAPEAGCGKAWKVLARDVVLKDSGGNNAAANPYGAAQVGNRLFIIDYDTRFIYTLGVNELNGLPPGDHTLAAEPFDPNSGTGGAGLPANAHGQAIIAVSDGAGNPFLFALYTVSSPNPDPSVYIPDYTSSILVKIAIDPAYGFLSYVEKRDDIAKNAQELIYIENFDGTTPAVPGLLIPALGGGQHYGTTNLDESNLQLVRPFAGSGSAMAPAIPLLIGDNPPAATPTYDIRAVAVAPDADSNGSVFVLTGTMDANANQDWKLYQTILSSFRTLNNTPLSQASSMWAADSGAGSPGYYWDIYYENGTGPTTAGDRLWFLRGSPIVIGPVSGFSTATKKTFPTGYAAGQIGGINVDSATLVSETMKQAAKGVSLKRGLRGMAVTPQEEEEEE
jgi:hypothetical protein